MLAFEVADDSRWLDVFGVVPQTEEVSGDDYVREVRISVGETEDLHITWDATDNSVRIRQERDGRIVVDLHRELVTRLLLERHGTNAAILVEYGGEDCSGRSRIQVDGRVVIEDVLLRR